MRNLLFYLALAVSFASVGNNLPEAYSAMRKVYEEGTTIQAKEEALKFLSLAKQENDAYYLVKVYYLLGYLASESDDFGNAIIYYLEGARFSEETGDAESKATLISIYKNLSWILRDYKHFELSHKFINSGLMVASELDNSDQIKSLINNRIIVLLEEEKYSEGLHQIDSLHSLFDLEGVILLKMLNIAGIAYQNIGELQLASDSYKQVLINGREIAPEIYASSLQNMGTIFLENKDYVEALNYFKEQIIVAQAEGLHQLLFQSLELSGKTYFELGDYENALSYFKEAALLDEKGGLEPDTYTVYEKLSNVYEKTGDFRKALYYKDVYARKLEAFLADQKKIEELDKKHNIQLLTQRYFDLLAANKKQQETEQIAKIGVGATTTFFILFIFRIYYKRYRLKRTLEEEIRKIELLSDV